MFVENLSDKHTKILVILMCAFIILVTILLIISFVGDDTQNAQPEINYKMEEPTITCSYLNNTFAVAHFNIPWSYYNKNEYTYFINSSYNGEQEILDQKSGYITIASLNKDEYMSIVVENINTKNRTIMTYAKCEGEMK
jgi:hypothetical protein